MLRVLSAVMVFFACIIFGAARSAALSGRTRQLKALYADISALAAETEMRGLPLCAVTGSRRFRMKEFWCAFTTVLNAGGNSAAAWDAASGSAGVNALKEADMSDAASFFEQLGSVDREKQRELFAAYERQLEKSIADAASAEQRCSKLFATLGVLGGLAGALLII